MKREKRPWGNFEVLATGPRYTIKVLRINPGGRTSLQRHRGREEYWTVVEGKGIAEVGKWAHAMHSYFLECSDRCVAMHVRRSDWHRIWNNGTEDLVMLELWRGDILSEEDIERIEDDYGRA